MALIKCPECKKEISNQADVCPNCGYPIRRDIIKQKEKREWYQLTQLEKNKITAYRKLKKEWWDAPIRLMAMTLLIIGIIFVIIGLLVGFNAPLVFLGIGISVVGDVLAFLSFSECEKWYNQNKDRVYEDKVIE